MSRLLRIVVPLAILAVVVVQVGAGPFRQAIASLGPGALLAALLVTAGTTVCSAWRWQTVAAAYDVRLGLGEAVAHCYRAQLLNATLPIGVLGDVERGVRRGLKPVVLERISGQVLQVALTLVALFPPLAAATAALPFAPSRVRRVVIASALACAGYVLLFVVAAHAVAPHAVRPGLVPVALVVLVAAALPANLAGWGPREAAAGFAFAAIGLTAAEGVAVSVAYGVLALVGTLPGAVVHLVSRREVAVA